MPIDFPLPNTKSPSLKNVQVVSPETRAFNHFVIESEDSFDSPKDISDTRRIRLILLVRVKHQLPAPRVWTHFEHLLQVPPRYTYNVWMDSKENPQHFWAGDVELKIWNRWDYS